MSTGDLAQRLWNNAGHLKGPEVEAYYAWRGVAVPETDSLRFVASLPHKSGASFPAIIARAENIRGDLTGVQRTFLAHDGAGKAPVDKKLQKMSLGPTKGSMVRLAESRDGVPLLLGEGVETVLTAMQASGLPGWATLGTSGLKAVNLPDNVKDVILLGENDDGKNAKANAKAAMRKLLTILNAILRDHAPVAPSKRLTRNTAAQSFVQRSSLRQMRSPAFFAMATRLSRSHRRVLRFFASGNSASL